MEPLTEKQQAVIAQLEQGILQVAGVEAVPTIDDADTDDASFFNEQFGQLGKPLTDPSP